MRVIAIDPGPTIGWVEVEMYGFNPDRITLLCSGETRRICDIPLGNAAIIVFERYFITRPGQNVEAAEVIGYVKEFCRQNGIIPVEQDPSVLGYIDARYLSDKTLYGFGIHAKDAIRHLLYYIAHTRATDIKEFLEVLSKAKKKKE